jgi:hypothetical protein
MLAYAHDLKLYMRVGSTDDCRLFQQDLDRLHGWCREKKYDLNAGKCKSFSFSRRSKPGIFQYVIGERVDMTTDLGVLVDKRMSFVNHIESIVSKSATMLRFIKQISREFNAFVKVSFSYIFQLNLFLKLSRLNYTNFLNFKSQLPTGRYYER